MKKLLSLFILALLPMLASAQTALDVQNSGCLSETRGEEPQRVPTIILTKEGNTLSVQLLNYESNCATQDFNVSSSINGEGGIYGVSVDINPVLPELVTSCLCPFNISFTIHDMEPNCFYLNCWWYSGNVELTEGEPLVLDNNNPDTQEYFPEGTKWTEIRLDTLKYDSWYSKVGDEWVPNFETIEYYVKGEYTDNNGKKYKCVYTNGPEWTDSLTLLLQEKGDAEYVGYNTVMVSVLAHDDDGSSRTLWPGEAYQFDWTIGKGLYFKDILLSNTTSFSQSYCYYGIIDEIKEGNFGGVRPLKYVDLDGKAPDNDPNSPIRNASTNGGRILQGIGITEWNDGECLFGPPNPYGALRMFDSYPEEKYPQCHYRSMLVYFERNGEVLYNVWPDKSQQNDYIPFVERGKQWHVARFTPGHNDMDVVDYCIPQGIEEINGNNYYKMKAILNNTTEIETYLIREENRKVYLYDPDLKMEYLMFDFSLKEGDIYESYSNESHSLVRYRVVSVEDCTEGPQVREYYYDETADTMAVRYRYLRKWKVVYVDYGYALAPRIWIEGIGSLRNPFSGMSDGYYSLDHLTYIINNGQSDNYLPFSFNEWWNKEWFGCNLPIGEKYESSEDRHHQLTYELEGKRLHVYGKVFCNCGPNHYAYFIEEPREQTDDPLVRKFHLIIQDVEPLIWCEGLHATDFYVEGVNPAYDYYIVDNQGEEHHVINKAPLYVYRPFVEDGKVWAVKVVSDGPPAEEWIEYYYFDGDTIVNGQTAKRMLCDRITSRQKTSGEYVGAWYEQNKEVYFAASGKQQFELLYDFSLINYDTMPSPDGSTWVVYKWTGIYPGFKGTYFTLGQEFWYEGVGSNSWPFVNHPWGYDGDKGVLLECSVGDEVIYYNSAEGYPYGMGARKRFDFTHTIKTKPKARNRSGAEAEQSLYGEYNDQQLGINLNPLDYAYLVSITDETGKVVYEKSINASNIVGLNIDISAYEKGHYAVIVENSDETFTGEFDAQTTGIEAISYQPSTVRHHIYNLQGQRLSTLQKGLNIVNGQKIYVK